MRRSPCSLFQNGWNRALYSFVLCFCLFPRQIGQIARHHRVNLKSLCRDFSGTSRCTYPCDWLNHLQTHLSLVFLYKMKQIFELFLCVFEIIFLTFVIDYAIILALAYYLALRLYTYGLNFIALVFYCLDVLILVWFVRWVEVPTNFVVVVDVGIPGNVVLWNFNHTCWEI